MGATDLDLLRRYAADGCEDAFAQLVDRHLGLVHGVAARIVRDRMIAEEVAQSVFVELARRAESLGRDTILPAWLHEVARRKAIDSHRREQRRLRRENLAMEQLPARSESTWHDLASILDEGLGALGGRDRTALVLRYLRGDSLREVASALRISEDAAQKRVSRALERLRGALSRRGAPVGASTLASALSANAAAPAPAGLAEAIGARIADFGAGSACAGGWLSAVTLGSPGKILVTAIALVAAGSGVHQGIRAARLQSQTAQLENANASALRDLAEARSLLESRNAELMGLRARNEELEGDRLELLRLRGEVGGLRAQARASRSASVESGAANDPSAEAIKSWIRRVQSYKALAEGMPERAIPELRLLTEEDWYELAKEPLGLEPDAFDFNDPEKARMALSAARAKAKHKLAWVFHRALQGYADAHEGRIPEDMRDLEPYLMHTNVVGPARAVQIAAGAVREDILTRYRIVAAGGLDDQPGDTPVVVERSPVDDEFDTLLRLGNHWFAVGSTKDPVP